MKLNLWNLDLAPQSTTLKWFRLLLTKFLWSMVLHFYSRRPLPCSQFPEPARWRDPSQYNTIPPLHRAAMIQCSTKYGQTRSALSDTPQDLLDDAYRKLYPNHLSYRTGVTSEKYFSTSAVCHLVSRHNGSPGGGIIAENGKLIGMSACHRKHANNI